MKILALMILFIILINGSICAEVEKSREIYFATGGALPLSDFDVKYNYGFNASIGVGYKVARNFRVVPKVEVQTFALDNDFAVNVDNISNYWIFMSGLDLRWFKDVNNWELDPILLAGGGIAFARVPTYIDAPVYHYARSETHLYLNVGAGVDVKFSSKVSGFITCRYIVARSNNKRIEFVSLSGVIRLIGGR
jgi:opacity protein-like surface antigen